MRIVFIGGGNMASAIISGLMRNLAEQKIHVVEPDHEKCNNFSEHYSISATETAPIIDKNDVIVLCVKPQIMRQVCSELKTNGALIISIAAGIKSAAISRWLGGTSRVVRAMPNTPALIGKGVSGLFIPDNISADDKKISIEIMSASGSVYLLEHEKQIDDITCISGSGPAYVFYFMESMINAARQNGFNEDDARNLVVATFEGALALANSQKDIEINSMRKNVTSKGGTTEQAIAYFESNSLMDIIGEGIFACKNRAIQLADELSKEG